MSDDGGWGALFVIAALGAGAYWLNSKYEVVERSSVVDFAKLPDKPVPPPPPIRPSGFIEVGETNKNMVWTLNANTVKGDRKHRQGWVEIKSRKGKGPQPSSQNLYIVDCDTGAKRLLSLVEYDAKGNVTYSQHTPPEKASVSYNPPYTLGAETAEKLCLPGFGAPK